MALPYFDLNELPLDSPTNSPPPPISLIVDWPGLDEISENDATLYQGSNEERFHPPNEVQLQPQVNIPNLNVRSRNAVAGKKRVELKDSKRHDAMQILLSKSVNGVAPRGSTLAVANQFGPCHRTIKRIWKTARENNFKDVSVKRKFKCGKKPSTFKPERLSALPVTKRKTIRQTAFGVGMPKSTLWDRFSKGEVRRHTNTAKPFVTPECRISRMQHCLASLDQSSIPNSPRFLPMHDTIYIDEKWFFMSRKCDTCYVLPGEEEPYRNIRSSTSVQKVMFLAAVTRPRYNADGVCTFDGKIGVFPLVEPRAAKRNSRNRPRGTIEIKPIPSITRRVIRDFFINRILPAIVEKWPRDSLTEPIYIQQDNAPSHLPINDSIFLAAVVDTGLKISLVCQPANSPDLNVLDLGFFRAIQSLQTQEVSSDVPELITAVQTAFLEFDHIQCNNVFLTLQGCMVEILKCVGGNRYMIPHIAKARLRRHGQLPTVISCLPEVYANAIVRQAL